MKSFLWFLLVCAPLIMYAQDTLKQAQDDKGIKWTEGLSWQEIKEKAKKENKYIFLDCYATWCAPCKTMDKSVYTDSKVAKHLNEQFISVKLQMDQTSYDNEIVKKLYYDAKNIQKEYRVTTFPTFIFFSPKAIPLHMDVGYKSPEQFIALVKNALNPDKRYYSILTNFQAGKLNPADLKGIARGMKKLNNELSEKMAADFLNWIPQQELSNPDNILLMAEFYESPKIQEIIIAYLKRIQGKELLVDYNLQLINALKKMPEIQCLALDYLRGLDAKELSIKANLQLLILFNGQQKAKEIADKFINDLNEEDLFTKENIQLMAAFTKTSKDRGFDIFYNHGKKVNNVMNLKQDETRNVAVLTNDYANFVIEKIITKEEVGTYWDQAIKQNNINWKTISKNIRKKYNKKISCRVVLNSKVALYKYLAETKNKNWQEYIKNNIKKIQKYGTDTTNGFIDATILNNFSYGAIFLHSSDEKQLNTAIQWMKGVVRRRPDNDGHMDTYANLLYKVGRVGEAIEWEERALKTAIDNKSSENDVKAYEKIISMMKNGLPTW